jgi:hypothetical protein
MEIMTATNSKNEHLSTLRDPLSNGNLEKGELMSGPGDLVSLLSLEAA